MPRVLIKCHNWFTASKLWYQNDFDEWYDSKTCTAVFQLFLINRNFYRTYGERSSFSGSTLGYGQLIIRNNKETVMRLFSVWLMQLGKLLLNKKLRGISIISLFAVGNYDAKDNCCWNASLKRLSDVNHSCLSNDVGLSVFTHCNLMGTRWTWESSGVGRLWIDTATLVKIVSAHGKIIHTHTRTHTGAWGIYATFQGKAIANILPINPRPFPVWQPFGFLSESSETHWRRLETSTLPKGPYNIVDPFGSLNTMNISEVRLTAALPETVNITNDKFLNNLLHSKKAQAVTKPSRSYTVVNPIESHKQINLKTILNIATGI